MRQLISFFIGLYLVVAALVFGGGVYGFMSGETTAISPCPKPDNWLGWAAYRGALWPKTYFDDIDKTETIGDWFFVHYTPDRAACYKG